MKQLVTLGITVLTIMFMVSCKKNSSITDMSNNLKDQSEMIGIFSKSINTEEGWLNTYVNKDGNQQIVIPSAIWDQIAQESNFSERDTSISSQPQGICVTISTRKSVCKSGVGFRCGFFSCDPPPKEQRQTVSSRNRSRIYRAIISKNEMGTIPYVPGTSELGTSFN